MKDTQVAKTNGDAGALVEQVIAQGDLSNLSPADRNRYYVEVCKSIGLNPLTKPFEYLKLNNKLVLYAKRDAADQLRKIHGISITGVTRTIEEGICIVEAKAQDKTGRTDSDLGAVNIGALKGEAAANAILKAVTKAKRRVTLSIAGLGFLDETEVEDIPAEAKAISPHPEGMAIEHGSHAMDWPEGWNKTKLTKELRTLVSELEACDTEDGLASVLDEYATIIELCQRHMPAWWNERSERHPEFEPLEDRIERTRQRVGGIHEAETEDPNGGESWQDYDKRIRNEIARAMSETVLRKLQMGEAGNIADYSAVNDRAAKLLNKAFGDRYLELSQRPLDEDDGKTGVHTEK